MKYLIFGPRSGLAKEVIIHMTTNHCSVNTSDIDITNSCEVDEAVYRIEPDVVISFAARNIDSAAHKVSDDKVKRQIDTNIIGNINVTSSSLRHMRSGGGTIILFSSVLAMKPEFGTSIYAGCKGFIESYIKTVAHENMGKVNVVGIELGYFDGGLTHRISSDIKERIISSIPAKRLGTISELYNTIEYIVSTPYISGTTIKINGGLYA